MDIHDILIESVRALPKGDVAICLSSGVDSQSLLFAMMECGIEPHVYSFTLADRESTDFSVARSLADEYGLRFTKVTLPMDADVIISDCLLMARDYGARKKTEFECLWPFLYVYPLLCERYVVTGIPADGHFCLSKKGQMHYKDRLREFREAYFANPNAGQRIMRGKLAERYGKVNIDPYYSSLISESVDGYTWDELNKPYQKMPIRNAFKQFDGMKVRRHTNYQKGDSGISEYFELVLMTRLNADGKYKSVVGIYNKIVREL